MMALRRWHRWVAVPAAIFLGLIALTGVLLHLDMIRLGERPPGADQEARRPRQPIPADADLAAMVVRAATAARAERGLDVRTIQVNLDGPRVTVSAGPGGPPGTPQLLIDARTGQRIVARPPPASFHYVLQNIHAGYVFGWAGRIVSILSGLSLLALSITGIQLWRDMRAKRRKAAFFWK
ncbi:PepSY domain-containing protein [Sphingobium lactosutens]|uniref:PepSY domain-containing protein n=1 Tax=Sphingobium lactosutens DS20 TaxID=1331060 RepID=T0HIN1_9SPHN|nr:PepSY domain-containing protein [Sphingobium lactosutens]EQB12857.1 hypothetical protein RLDS_18960 [Sphingobium lactosutens DS20]